MDTVVNDVVTTSATKLNFDKRFLVGVALGAIVVGGAVGIAKLKKKFSDTEDEEA